MLQFDAETTALLERAYRGRDFVRRRNANLRALDPRPGARILDIGCGTGLLLAELAGAVGPSGHVTGLDPSPDMLAAARAECRGLGNVDIVEGSAASLPFEDASLDGIVSIQVFEYFDDPAPALAECARVLKPGGRLVIGDMHFSTLAWHSDDPARMARMCDTWDRHLANPAMPAHLPVRMREAGFAGIEAHAVPFTDIHFRPDGIARMMWLLLPEYARSNDFLPEDEVEAWAAEQAELAAAGRFFFSFTHIVTSGRRA